MISVDHLESLLLIFLAQKFETASLPRFTSIPAITARLTVRCTEPEFSWR
jgi:hypothetical protein